MTINPARCAPPALLLMLVTAAPTLAATKDGHLEITVAPGYDSNPLELNDAIAARRGGAFTQIGLDSRFAVQWNPLLGAFADIDGATRSHASDVAEADTDWIDARAGVTLTPWRRGPRGFAIAAGGIFGLYRGTYIDPATGEAYETFDGTAPVPVPDRFDFDATGAFMDVRWRTHERLLLYLDTEATNRRYATQGSETLAPLDDRTVSLQPGVLIDLGARFRIDLAYDWYDRRYDELPALDLTATAVPGEWREYRGGGYSLTVAFDPMSTLRFAVGWKGLTREDSYAGYYDSSGTSSFAAVDCSIGERTRLHGWVGRRQVEYDNATVDNTINGESLDSDRLLAIARAERDLARHLALFGEAGVDRTESRDPLFTYDRNWGQIGLRFRL